MVRSQNSQAVKYRVSRSRTCTMSHDVSSRRDLSSNAKMGQRPTFLCPCRAVFHSVQLSVRRSIDNKGLQVLSSYLESLLVMCVEIQGSNQARFVRVEPLSYSGCAKSRKHISDQDLPTARQSLFSAGDILKICDKMFIA